jgi:hypothetical protein
MRLTAVLFCVGLLAAQTQPGGQEKGRLEGSVVNAATSQPVARAWVSLNAAKGATVPAGLFTDEAGHFVFAGLAAGEYWIEAQRDSFMRDRGTGLTLASGEEKKDVVLRLTPYGAIAGRVRTEEGDPIPGLRVSVMAYDYRPGGRQLVSRGNAVTNDLGEYRVFELLAGRYAVRTERKGVYSPDEIYQATYFPGTTDPSGAAMLELGAGQELSGSDFTLRRTHTATVRGQVLLPAGASGGHVNAEVNPGRTIAAQDILNARNTFTLRGLPPGSYIIAAAVSVGEKDYRAQRIIQVTTADIEGLELRPAPPVDLNGTFRIEGSAKVKLSQAGISFPGSGRPSVIKDDGTFEIRGLDRMVHRPTVSAPKGLFVKSLRCGNADVTESGVDLTEGGACDLVVILSSNGGRIGGTVEGENGQPANDAAVTLVPQATGRTNLFRSVWSDATGHFELTDVAPGSYRLYAWETVNVNAVMYDPDFVKPFEGQGRSLQIGEGARENVSLKQIGKAAVR